MVVRAGTATKTLTARARQLAAALGASGIDMVVNDPPARLVPKLQVTTLEALADGGPASLHAQVTAHAPDEPDVDARRILDRHLVTWMP